MPPDWQLAVIRPSAAAAAAAAPDARDLQLTPTRPPPTHTHSIVSAVEAGTALIL